MDMKIENISVNMEHKFLEMEIENLTNFYSIDLFLKVFGVKKNSKI